MYEDDALAYFPFSEGTVRKISSTSFRLEYNLTDHLGNVRATFYPWQYNSPLLLQADSYYPFGLKMPGLSYVASGSDENKFTYNGKELEDEFGLDWYHYGVRFYDPVVGRWWVVDPADELYTPYAYTGNNPISFIDPDGSITTPLWYYTLSAWYSFNKYHFNNALETGNQQSKEIIVGQMKGLLYVDIAVGVAATGGLLAPYIAPAATKVASNPGTSLDVVTTSLKLADQANLAQVANEVLVVADDYLSHITVTTTSFDGGLVLYKWDQPQTSVEYGWRFGDYMLSFNPDLGFTPANWLHNESELLYQMSLGNQIFDSYIDGNGALIETGGFLGEERNTLLNAGWKFFENRGAWLPPELQEKQ